MFNVFAATLLVVLKGKKQHDRFEKKMPRNLWPVAENVFFIVCLGFCACMCLCEWAIPSLYRKSLEEWGAPGAVCSHNKRQGGIKTTFVLVPACYTHSLFTFSLSHNHRVMQHWHLPWLRPRELFFFHCTALECPVASMCPSLGLRPGTGLE